MSYLIHSVSGNWKVSNSPFYNNNEYFLGKSALQTSHATTTTLNKNSSATAAAVGRVNSIGEPTNADIPRSVSPPVKMHLYQNVDQAKASLKPPPAPPQRNHSSSRYAHYCCIIIWPFFTQIYIFLKKGEISKTRANFS